MLDTYSGDVGITAVRYCYFPTNAFDVPAPTRVNETVLPTDPNDPGTW